MAKWKHVRKGLIIGEIIHETDDGKWVKIKLENTVRGLNYSYFPGDSIMCYKPFLTLAEEAEVPKES